MFGEYPLYNTTRSEISDTHMYRCTVRVMNQVNTLVYLSINLYSPSIL